MSKTTTTKTTTTKTIKSNATKTNTMLTLDAVYALFVDGVNGKPIKLNYSNAKSQPYCGFDDFSVNMKKTAYNVYMNEINRDICTMIDKNLVVEPNACDTTKKQLRSWLIRFTDTDTLKKCITAVAKSRVESIA